MSNISRRSFLKGAAATGVVAALSSIGISAAAEEAAAADESVRSYLPQEEYDIAHPPAVEEPEPEYYYEDYGNYGGGGEPAQTEDSCVSDVILN